MARVGESSDKRIKHMLKCHSAVRNAPKPLIGTVPASCVPKCHKKPLWLEDTVLDTLGFFFCCCSIIWLQQISVSQV